MGVDHPGTEPERNRYTEPDLPGQARKLVMKYQTPKGRLEPLHGLDRFGKKIQHTENEMANQLSRGKKEQKTEEKIDPGVWF